MEFPPRRMIAAIRADMFEEVLKTDSAWMCVACYACTEVCPQKIPIAAGLMTRVKEELLLTGNVPAELQDALENSGRYDNPLGESPRKRAEWTKGIEPEIPIMAKAKRPVDVLWFVGDYPSYHPRVQLITKALAKVFPKTREQRCWVHKTANVLDKLPKRLQPEAKQKLHEIWMADTRENAHRAFDLFLATYEAKYPKACECLAKDRDVLLTFYDFPAEHWIHLRTTNPIESTFATVRLRTKRTKGSGTRTACLTMVFKLMRSAQRRWRTLNGSERLPDVIQGIPFVDGVKQPKAAA